MRKSKLPLVMFRPNGDRYWLVVTEARQTLERRITEGESLEAAMIEAMVYLAELTQFEQDTARLYLNRNAASCQAKRVSGL